MVLRIYSPLIPVNGEQQIQGVHVLDRLNRVVSSGSRSFNIYSPSLPHNEHCTCWFFLFAWWQRGYKISSSVFVLCHWVSEWPGSIWLTLYVSMMFTKGVVLGSLALGQYFCLWSQRKRTAFRFSSISHYVGKGNLLSWEDGQIGARCVEVSFGEWRKHKTFHSLWLQVLGYYFCTYFIAFLYILLLDEYFGSYSKNWGISL